MIWSQVAVCWLEHRKHDLPEEFAVRLQDSMIVRVIEILVKVSNRSSVPAPSSHRDTWNRLVEIRCERHHAA